MTPTTRTEFFDAFTEKVAEITGGTAADKGYGDEIRKIVGSDHAAGEGIYKFLRWKNKRNPDDLFKAAAWAFLLWLDNHTDYGGKSEALPGDPRAVVDNRISSKAVAESLEGKRRPPRADDITSKRDTDPDPDISAAVKTEAKLAFKDAVHRPPPRFSGNGRQAAIDEVARHRGISIRSARRIVDAQVVVGVRDRDAAKAAKAFNTAFKAWKADPTEATITERDRTNDELTRAGNRLKEARDELELQESNATAPDANELEDRLHREAYNR